MVSEPQTPEQRHALHRFVHGTELSPAERELMAMLSEECCEVGQVCSKFLRFGYKQDPHTTMTKTERIERELGDVCAVMSILVGYALIDVEQVKRYAEAKLEELRTDPGRLRFAVVP